MAKGKSILAASQKKVDPTLDALFASSSGPVQAPSAARYSELLPLREQKPPQPTAEASAVSNDDFDGGDSDDEVLSELGSDQTAGDEEGSEDGERNEGLSGDTEDDASDVVPEAEEVPGAKAKERKRKRRDEHDDLEARYFKKLADEDTEVAPNEKRRRADNGGAIGTPSTQPAAMAENGHDEDDAPIVHESLIRKADEHVDVEVDKANRTLFLGNVSSEAISAGSAKKQLLAHLASPLASLDPSTGPHKVESLRFRSTAFAGGGMPKRAAYITKSLMSTTTKSTNAYVVYSTTLAARAALKALNGTVVLGRHLRADSVAHPTPIDHRRCVFVGNLGFVDDETVVETNAEGETITKKRTKVPADMEEGLWRTFGKAAGKVESVRMPRDANTRVGKGFAYVQFYDANHVEGALLLDGKKFPPMLPRILRVSRAKDPRKTALAMERTTKARLEAAAAADKSGPSGAKSTKYKHKATPEQQSLAGRAGRLLGRAGAARQQRELKGGGRTSRPREAQEATGSVDLSAIKTPEQIIFEGRRASAKDGRPKDLKFKGQKSKKAGGAAKAKGRGATRAAAWRQKRKE